MALAVMFNMKSKAKVSHLLIRVVQLIIVDFLADLIKIVLPCIIKTVI
jgi:hypothetical protein